MRYLTEHPDDYDREQFKLQTELREWKLLWWEKEKLMNKLWYHRLHNWPARIR